MFRITTEHSQREKGALNIASFAVVLPILVLLAAAAIDIIRLPLAKQQLLGTLSSAYDSLAVPGKFQGSMERAAAKNLCAALSEEQQAGACSECSEPTASCSAGLDYQLGAQALQSSLDFVVKELTEQTSAIFQHSPDALAIDMAIFNLALDDSGKLTRIEAIAEGSYPDGASGKPNRDLKSYISNALERSNGSIPRVWLTKASDGAAKHIEPAIAVMRVSVRIRHIFGITKKLTTSLSSEQGEEKDNYSQISATLVRPLSQGIYLHFP